MNVDLINANSTIIPLADQSVHMVATSPPYWGLRSYQTGDLKSYELGSEPLHDCYAWTRGDPPCGACYVCNMRAVAAELWRVLRDDGIFWLNLGDSYQSSNSAQVPQTKDVVLKNSKRASGVDTRPPKVDNLKQKDLVGIPWRVALALQADGWWLRSGMPWIKRNSMPESASDRPNTAVEYVYLFTKSERYFFDMDAVRVALSSETIPRVLRGVGSNHKNATGAPGQTPHTIGKARKYSEGYENINPAGRNFRNSDPFFASLQYILDRGQTMLCDTDPLALVVNTSGWSGAHFATWPPALVEPMIKAGTSEYGVCAECKAPWERVVERNFSGEYNHEEALRQRKRTEGAITGGVNFVTLGRTESISKTTIDWRPTCECRGIYRHVDSGTGDHLGDQEYIPDPIPATILDPFAGSGTTGVVARQLGRHFVGLDLSYQYLHDQARARLELDKLDAWQNGKNGNGGAALEELPLFKNL